MLLELFYADDLAADEAETDQLLLENRKGAQVDELMVNFGNKLIMRTVK